MEVIGYITLGLIICGLIFWGLMALYRKSDTAKSLMLMYTMHRRGPESIVTIDLIENIVRDLLIKDGVAVTECSVVHEMGNRYHGCLTIDGEKCEMTIIADKTGAIHYKILEQ